MSYDDQGGTPPRPWQIATVRGEPYEVRGLSLTPAARIITYAVGRGKLHSHSLAGWAAGFVRVKPLAFIVGHDEQEQRIELGGALDGALAGMIALGAAVTLALWVVRLLARGRRSRQRMG